MYPYLPLVNYYSSREIRL